MGYLTIHCHDCGGSWCFYPRDDPTERKSRTCPHCGAEVDPETWSRAAEAYKALESVTVDLINDHAGKHGTLFSLDYVSNVSPGAEDGEIREEIEDLQQEVSALRAVLQRGLESLFSI